MADILYFITSTMEKIGVEICFIGMLAIAFSLQLFCCFKMKKVILKLIPIVFFLLILLFFFYAIRRVDDEWDVFGFFVLIVWGGYGFLACVASWIIFGVTKIVRKKPSETE